MLRSNADFGEATNYAQLIALSSLTLGNSVGISSFLVGGIYKHGNLQAAPRSEHLSPETDYPQNLLGQLWLAVAGFRHAAMGSSWQCTCAGTLNLQTRPSNREESQSPAFKGPASGSSITRANDLSPSLGCRCTILWPPATLLLQLSSSVSISVTASLQRSLQHQG